MEEELRRANIVYFLTHDGTVERPRVITVHYLHNDCVHLRDVKRWLAELRGKDMPDSYSWSYKRRYKNGYKWHELKDDDLITPISDENEYILKGSFIRFCSLDGFSYEDTDKRVKTSKQIERHQTVTEHKLEPKVSQQLEHESWIDLNQETDSKDRLMAIIKTEASRKKQEEQQRHERRYSCRTSHVFCNILTCKKADTDDSVLRPTDRAHGGSHERRSSGAVLHQQQKNGAAEAENSRKGRRNNGGKRSTKRTASVKYKPAGAPNCSQCGRRFDPEKFQSHMRSCKALKG